MKRIYLIIMTVCFLLADAGHTYSRTLNLKAGQLKNLFKTYELDHERDLTLIGSINGSDLKVLRDWAGDSRTLDLGECRIVAGGEPYYEDYTTENDVLGSYLFGDKEFKRLVLPWTLKKIGDYAISFCGDSINLPSSLTWLGDYAFVNNNFKKLHLPASLEHIGNAALNGNISLADVTLDANNPYFVLEDGYLYTRDHSRLLSYFDKISTRTETFTIRPEVRTIDDKANGCRICSAQPEGGGRPLLRPSGTACIFRFSRRSDYADTRRSKKSNEEMRTVNKRIQNKQNDYQSYGRTEE